MAREKLSDVFPESVRRLAEKVGAPVPSWYAGQLHAHGKNGNGNGNGNGSSHPIDQDAHPIPDKPSEHH
jgi:hypothetical protein